MQLRFLSQLEAHLENLLISMGSVAGQSKHVRGENYAGSATLVTIASLTLEAGGIYRGIEITCSCFRESLFQVIVSDNGVETNVMDLLVSPNAPSYHSKKDKLELTAGSTGPQLLSVKGINISSLSAMRVTLATSKIVEDA